MAAGKLTPPAVIGSPRSASVALRDGDDASSSAAGAFFCQNFQPSQRAASFCATTSAPHEAAAAAGSWSFEERRAKRAAMET